MRVGVTGIGGYVGSLVGHDLRAAGHTVIALGRRADGPVEWRPYDLARVPAAELVDDVDVVIHCAYDLTLTAAQDIERVNVVGTRRLVDLCGQTGTRFILASSMSAYPGTRQLYGRAKLASEADVTAAGGCSVRLGLVYGENSGGMIASLSRFSALPIIPLIGSSTHQFMVHAGDMARALTRLAEDDTHRGEVAGLAHPEPVPFTALVRTLARAQGRDPQLLPIPWRPVYFAMRAAEAAGVRLPLRADSILGLVRPALSVPNVELWQRLGVAVRRPALTDIGDHSLENVSTTSRTV
jgi:nucleoside-diphosphate-sugar epimerase